MLPCTRCDLGKVAVGDVATATLEVQNIDLLFVESLTLSPEDPVFSVDAGADPLPVELEPGEVLALELTFAPEVEGAAKAALLVGSNDPSTPEATAALTGTGLP
jgi:hypothetical protein